MGLDSVELVIETEDEFGITIADEDASRCITIGDLRDIVIRELMRAGASRTPEVEEEVWRRLVIIVSEQMGVRPHTVHPATRFIEDLHMD